MSEAAEIVVLGPREVEAAADQLADVLLDCIAGGASVSFMASFTHREAFAFFWNAAVGVADGHTVLAAAKLGDKIVGTVQLNLNTPPNQPHRADVMKMLVHRSARKRGIGAALMKLIEAEAAKRGRTLLVLDTASGDAERLYVRSGWIRAGVIPDYALWPQGGFCDTTIFWKQLGA